MFYSHTLLARKEPLGTVWCAAHLQNRLKKSHFTSTNIVSAVECIMFPQVPMALRMSSHLLLGVVRIYSKKVDYLHRDCNLALITLRKAFSSVDMNLMEDARAPVAAITLPQTLDLSAVNLDDDICDNRYNNNHIGNREDITLMDQIPAERDPYIVISFDEDITMDDDVGNGTTKNAAFSLVKCNKIVQDKDPGNLGDEHNATPQDQDPSPINRTEVPNAEAVEADSRQTVINVEVLLDVDNDINVEIPQIFADQRNEAVSFQNVLDKQVMCDADQDINVDIPQIFADQTNEAASPRNVPDKEVMRDADHDINVEKLPQLSADLTNKAASPQSFPDIEVMRDADHNINVEIIPPMLVDQTKEVAIENSSSSVVRKDMGNLSATPDYNTFPSGAHFGQSRDNSLSTASDASRSVPVTSEGNVPVNIELQASPLVQEPKPRQRKRKALDFFDESIVLSNRFLKRSLKDTVGIQRKKRDNPYSALEQWRFEKRLKKDQCFIEPLFTGLCTDLCNIEAKPREANFREANSKENSREANSKEASAREANSQEANAHNTNAQEVNSHEVNAGEANSPEVNAQEANAPVTVAPESSIAEAMQEARTGETAVIVTEATRDRSPPSVPDTDDMHIDRLRDFDSRFEEPNMELPLEADHSTPFGTKSFDLGLEAPSGTTQVTEGLLPTPIDAAFTGNNAYELEIPRTFSTEHLNTGSFGLPYIPEAMNSGEPDDLYFLEDNTPQGSQGSQDSQGSQGVIDSFSVRTRAVIQYLERHSPIDSEEPTKDLSLNKILEGRKRKLCARMFYETLVLKNNGKIDVKQEEPYGDITLRMIALSSKTTSTNP